MAKITPGLYERMRAATGGRKFQVIIQLRRNADSARREIDHLLASHGGLTLSDPNRFGYMLVESPAEGVLALADSTDVDAVLENQPLERLTVHSS